MASTLTDGIKTYLALALTVAAGGAVLGGEEGQGLKEQRTANDQAPAKTLLQLSMGSYGVSGVMAGSQVGAESADGGTTAIAFGALVCRMDGDVSGLALSGVGSLVYGELLGLQVASIGCATQGSTAGLQIAGSHCAVQSDMAGLQIGGLKCGVKGEMTGVQMSLWRPFAHGHVKGLQAGLGCGVGCGFMGRRVKRLTFIGVPRDRTASNLNGLQIGLIANRVTGDATGAQVAGLLNRAKGVRGMQFGLINICTELSGGQVGLINICRGRVLPFMPIANVRFRRQPCKSGPVEARHGPPGP